MNEIDFRKRVYADPNSEDADISAAAESDERLAAILSEAKALDSAISQANDDISVPANLRAELLTIPATADNADTATAEEYESALAQTAYLDAAMLQANDDIPVPEGLRASLMAIPAAEAAADASGAVEEKDASSSSDYASILADTKAIDEALLKANAGIEVPEDLRAQLMAIPARDSLNEQEQVLKGLADKPAANSSLFQYLAVAASLVLAVGVAFSIGASRGPSPAEIAFGDAVLQHLIHEQAELSAVSAGSMTARINPPTANFVMASTGFRFNDQAMPSSATLRLAKPCKILPSSNSAHLIIQGAQGAVSVIVVNNSPVGEEFSIGDSSHKGLVIPLQGGNVVLIGEPSENLEGYRDVLTAAPGPVI